MSYATVFDVDAEDRWPIASVASTIVDSMWLCYGYVFGVQQLQLFYRAIAEAIALHAYITIA